MCSTKLALQHACDPNGFDCIMACSYYLLAETLNPSAYMHDVLLFHVQIKPSFDLGGDQRAALCVASAVQSITFVAHVFCRPSVSNLFLGTIFLSL